MAINLSRGIFWTFDEHTAFSTGSVGMPRTVTAHETVTVLTPLQLHPLSACSVSAADVFSAKTNTLQLRCLIHGQQMLLRQSSFVMDNVVKLSLDRHRIWRAEFFDERFQAFGVLLSKRWTDHPGKPFVVHSCRHFFNLHRSEFTKAVYSSQKQIKNNREKLSQIHVQQEGKLYVNWPNQRHACRANSEHWISLPYITLHHITPHSSAQALLPYCISPSSSSFTLLHLRYQIKFPPPRYIPFNSARRDLSNGVLNVWFGQRSQTRIIPNWL